MNVREKNTIFRAPKAPKNFPFTEKKKRKKKSLEESENKRMIGAETQWKLS